MVTAEVCDQCRVITAVVNSLFEDEISATEGVVLRLVNHAGMEVHRLYMGYIWHGHKIMQVV